MTASVRSPWRASVLAVLAVLVRQCVGEIVGAVVFGHSENVWDPRLDQNSQGAIRHRASSYELGELVASQMAPDIIVQTTPHSLAMDSLYGVLLGDYAEGFALVGMWSADPPFPPYRQPVNATLDREFADELVDFLQLLRGQPVRGQITWWDTEPVPLRWAEAYPIFYLEPALRSAGLVIMTHPNRMKVEPSAMVPELIVLGEAMFDFLHSRPERIVVSITNDMGHDHPGASSVIIDAATLRFVETQNTTELTSLSNDDLVAAGHDGFTGLVMLDGLLKRAPFPWQSTIYDYYLPEFSAPFSGNPSCITASYLPVSKS